MSIEIPLTAYELATLRKAMREDEEQLRDDGLICPHRFQNECELIMERRRYPSMTRVFLLVMSADHPPRLRIGDSRQPYVAAHLSPLQLKIKEVISKHGSLRAAARSLDTDSGYLNRLLSGERTNPRQAFLSKLGLDRSVIQRKKG